jgi:hypothetical protein
MGNWWKTDGKQDAAERRGKSMSQERTLPVGIGTHVIVQLIDAEGTAEAFAFDLVHADAADLAQGRLGADTPLAQARRGKRAGAVVVYAMGDICRVQIVEVLPATTPAPKDAAARRAAVLEEARRKAERTNTDMFASSYSGKWGDYHTEDMAEDVAEDVTKPPEDAG